MPKALKIDVKFCGQPKEESVFAGREGGFAFAYGISLDDPMPVNPACNFTEYLI